MFFTNCQLNGKSWRATAEFFQLSYFSIIHRESWVLTKIKFHHSSNVLIHDTGLTMSEVWRWWDILVRIEYLSNETSWYIVEPWPSSFIQNTSLLHIPLEWLISMDSHQKIILMTWIFCQMTVTHKVCCSLLCCSQQSLKPTPVIFATLMVYDFIDHIPQQVSLSIYESSFHTSLPS